MRGMDLNSVDSGFLRDHGAGDELFDHGFNFFRGQRSRLLADDPAGDVGSRHGLFSSDQSARSLVARMMQLHEQLCVIGMNCLYEPVKLRDHMCIRYAQLVRSADSGLIIDPCDLSDYESCSSSCPVGVILYHPCSRFAGRLCQ